MKQNYLKSFFARFLTLLVLALLSTNYAWGTDYVKVTSAPTDWSGEYLLVYESSTTAGVAWTGVDAASCNVAVTISNGTIASKPTDAVTLTIAAMQDGYSIKVNGGTNNGKYIYGTSAKNQTNFGANASVNTISYDATNKGVLITSNTSVMRYNSSTNNGNWFRYYKSTSYTGQNIVQLYKKEEATKTITSIAVKTTPSKTEYFVGDYFNPAGLEITATYDTGSPEEIAYAGNESKFTFNPTLTTALQTSNTSVEIAYGGKKCSQTITVNTRPAFTVTLGDNNETLTEEAAGEGVILPEREPANKDYTFAGWSTANVETETEVAPSIIPAGTYHPSANITLYPIFSRTETGSGFSKYEKVTSAPADWSGQYLLSTGTYTATGAISSNHLTRDEYKDFDKEATSREFTLTKVGDAGYSIKFGDNYLGWTDGTNFTTDTNTPTNTSTGYLWTPSTDNISNVAKNTRIIADNGSTDFRPYASPTTGIVYLYKRIEGGSTTYYTSNPAAIIVEAPTFTPAETEFLESTSVSLACATEGASIYYTLDGTEPTKASTQYTEAINISETTTIKAIAYKGDDASSVASKTYTKIAPLTTMDEIFNASATTGDYWIIFNNWVVSGVKGSNAYITDNAGKGLIVYTSSHGFEVGDKLSGTVMCALTKHNGSAEITNLTSTTEGLTVTKNGTVNTVNATIANLGGVNTGAYINLDALTYNGTMFTDGINTIKPYDAFITLPTLTNGKKYYVKGIYIQYNSTKEIAPLTEEDFAEVPATEYDITITPCENGSVTVDAKNNKAQASQVVTLTITPETHYALLTLSVTDASSKPVTVSEDYKFTMPASDVTISATFAELTEYTVTYHALGTQIGTEQVYDGELIATAPTATTLEGWTFEGWTVNSEYAMSTTSPELFDLETPITEDINLYAVYSKTEGGSGSLAATLTNEEICNSELTGSYATGSISNDYGTWNYNATKQGNYGGDGEYFIQIRNNDNVSYIKVPEFSGDITSIVLNKVCNTSKGKYTGSFYFRSECDNSADALATGTSSEALDNVTLTIPVGHKTGYIMSSGACRISSITVNYTSGTTYYTISVPRTQDVEITTAKYATLGLPYAVTIPEGVSAYTATVEGTTVTMTKISGDVIPANCGVILYADVETPTTYTFTETTDVAHIESNKLVAVIGETYTCGNDYGKDYYLGLSNGQATFKKLALGGTIAAGKAYLKLDAALKAGAKLDVTFGEPTGITSYENDNENENLKSMTVYNLNGMKVNEAYKGIVIMNGKKYINK